MTQYDADRLLGYEQDAIDDLRARDREDAERDEDYRREHEHALAYGGEHSHCGICGECTPGEAAGVVFCSAACEAEDDRVMTAFYQQATNTRGA